MTLLGLDIGTRLLSIGTYTVTAGSPQQLPNTRCKLVVIQADESNGDISGNNGILAVGGSTVNALSSPPTAIAMLYATNRDEFRVMNANELYVDSTVTGAKFSYAIFG